MMLAALAVALSAIVAQAPPPRPNIVWTSNEDMSPRLGAYGDTLARTPHLDALAKASIRYTNAFTTAPVCAPSRAALITGLHQNAIGAQHMRTTEDSVPELPGPYLAVPAFYVKAFPEYPRAAGYHTSNRAKTDYQFGVPFSDQLVSFVDLAPTVLVDRPVTIRAKAIRSGYKESEETRTSFTR
jgi:arylsulfatase A-like enzyme